MKIISCLIVILCSISTASPQNNETTWIETQAKIIEIENKIKARGTRSFAKVAFVDGDGEKYEGRIELLAIPLIGTLKSVGDSVTVYYDAANPMLVKSPETSFLESYGLYILIVAGAFIGFFGIRKKLGELG